MVVSVTRRTKKATPRVVRSLDEVRAGNELATVEEAATILRCHRSTIYRLAERGVLQQVRYGESVRIRWDSVEALIKGGVNVAR